MTYFDLDDILASAEKIPCKFNSDAPGLGYLQGNPGHAIPKNAKVEVPFWLASVLVENPLFDEDDQEFIELGETKFETSQFVNAIRASGVSVDLHLIYPYYYDLVVEWSKLHLELPSGKQAMKLLNERAMEIYNYANNTNKPINNRFLLLLDEFEKVLFKKANELSKQTKQWLEGS